VLTRVLLGARESFLFGNLFCIEVARQTLGLLATSLDTQAVAFFCPQGLHGALNE
jgi:hypothetical protein